ncbi:organic solute transporter Ostalpha-domain-containing protein [Mortierella sp. GBAus27b]|nr:organic solute transporter Ostalpha-domain-containing protein [Mortierella sp. GBAus27b]
MSSNISAGEGILIPEAKVPEPIFWTMAAFAAAATLISFISVWYHFRNYTMPRLQRYVIRIHLMVPIYAISSIIALRSLGFAFYIDAIRDIYEGFVLYCFFNLLVLKLGGERAFLSTAVKRQPVEHHAPVRWFSKDVNVGDPDSFRHIKRCIMLFVCVKPLVAVTTVVLKANGYYVEGLIAWTSTYLWLSVVSTISACLSLYYLCLFVEGVESDIKEFKPVKKLLWVKAIIFFAFWQGVAISLLISTGIWADANYETAIAIQDSLICVEALVAAFGHWEVFSYKEYAESSGLPRAGMRPSVAIKDAFGSKDIVQDFTETWSGEDVNYREYEPSEGMAKDSKDQMRRIRDGLRYSQGGTSKYWLPENSNHGAGHQNGSIHSGDVVIPVSIPA